MKTLIIFTNNTKIEAIQGTETGLGTGQNFELNNIQIKIFSDTGNEAKLISNNLPIAPQDNNEDCYFILHRNAQENYKDDFQKKYPKAHIKLQSHVNGEFYKIYLHKIEGKTFNQDDLEEIFKTKLEKVLDNLCNTWSTLDFNKGGEIKALTDERKDSLDKLV